MKKYLLLVLLLLVQPVDSFAAFPKGPITIQLPADSTLPPVAEPLPSRSRNFKTIFPRIKERFSGNKSDNSGRSLLCFLLSIASYITLLMGFATFSFTGTIIFLFLSLGICITSIVLGISALVRRKKLKGLAIAGITLSGLILLSWTTIFILATILTY
jgi:hypothetical protein